jgi:hypothetical protein
VSILSIRAHAALQSLGTFGYGAPECLPAAPDNGLWAMSFQPRSYQQSGVIDRYHVPGTQYASARFEEFSNGPFEGEPQALNALPQDSHPSGLGSGTDSYTRLCTNMSNVGYYGSQ